MSRKEEIIARIKSAKKNYNCTGCKQTFTILVSLNCNCGGKIVPIGEEERNG